MQYPEIPLGIDNDNPVTYGSYVLIHVHGLIQTIITRMYEDSITTLCEIYATLERHL